jgi:hypothetical protein
MAGHWSLRPSPHRVQSFLEQPRTIKCQCEVRKDTLNTGYLRVISAVTSPTGHGLETQPSSMTAVTPVASRKARPTLDFNNSPLSDRTRRLFPSIISPPLVQIGQDDTTEFSNLSPSPIVLIRANSLGEDSSIDSPIVSISNNDPNQDLNTTTYRSTNDLPHELETHCNIYLEERLCE